MTDCGCDKAKAELEEFLHRELSETDLQDIQEHLDNCEDCSTEHLVGLTLIQKVQRACQEKAPDELRASIRQLSIAEAAFSTLSRRCGFGLRPHAPAYRLAAMRSRQSRCQRPETESAPPLRSTIRATQVVEERRAEGPTRLETAATA